MVDSRDVGIGMERMMNLLPEFFLFSARCQVSQLPAEISYLFLNIKIPVEKLRKYVPAYCTLWSA